MKDKTMKIVVVGDGFCGKTSLIVAYTSGSFNERYVPTAFDDFSVEVTVNGETVRTSFILFWNSFGSQLFLFTFRRT